MDRLPKDVVMLLFAQLNHQDFRSFSLVCKHSQMVAREAAFAAIFHARKCRIKYDDNSMDVFFLESKKTVRDLINQVVLCLGLPLPLRQYHVYTEKEKILDSTRSLDSFPDGTLFLFSLKRIRNIPTEGRGKDILYHAILNEMNEGTYADMMDHCYLLCALRAQEEYGDFDSLSTQSSLVQKLFSLSDKSASLQKILPLYARSLPSPEQKRIQQQIVTIWKTLKGTTDVQTQIVLQGIAVLGSVSFQVLDAKKKKSILMISPRGIVLRQMTPKKLIFTHSFQELYRFALLEHPSLGIALDFQISNIYRVYSDKSNEIIQLLHDSISYLLSIRESTD